MDTLLIGPNGRTSDTGCVSGKITASVNSNDDQSAPLGYLKVSAPDANFFLTYRFQFLGDFFASHSRNRKNLLPAKYVGC